MHTSTHRDLVLTVSDHHVGARAAEEDAKGDAGLSALQHQVVECQSHAWRQPDQAYENEVQVSKSSELEGIKQGSGQSGMGVCMTVVGCTRIYVNEWIQNYCCQIVSVGFQCSISGSKQESVMCV